MVDPAFLLYSPCLMAVLYIGGCQYADARCDPITWVQVSSLDADKYGQSCGDVLELELVEQD